MLEPIQDVSQLQDGAEFSSEIQAAQAKPQLSLLPSPQQLTCPSCGSNRYSKRGKNEQGIQRYQCQNYQRLFPESYRRQALIPDGLSCPHCQSHQCMRAGKCPNGTQIYRCRTCRKRFIENYRRAVIPEGLTCPRCESQNCIRTGKKNGHQYYKCKACKKIFTEHRHEHQHHSNLPLSDDVWDIRDFGLTPLPHNYKYKLVFRYIHQFWLKATAKKFVKYNLATKSYSTVASYISFFNSFSRFLREQGLGEIPQDINRPIALQYLEWLGQKNLSVYQKNRYLYLLKTFFETATREKWLEGAFWDLIREEDYAKSSRQLPRYIPEEVVQQLNQHLDSLPESVRR